MTKTIVMTVLTIVTLRWIARTRVWARVDTTALLLGAMTLGIGFAAVLFLHMAVTGRTHWRTENILVGVPALAVALYSLFGLARYIRLKRSRTGSGEPGRLQ